MFDLRNKYTFYWLLIAFVLILLFSDILFSYFSQDDFFHFRAVMTKNFSDIPSFFISMQTEYAFYRPLSRETFNLIMYNIFGLNPLPFHLVNFALILTNISLLFLLVKRVIKNTAAPFLASFIYSVSSIHSIELYYLGSVQTLLATTLILLSVICYISFHSTKKFRFYFLTLLTFILALTSHETAIVLPGILFFTCIFLQREFRSILNKDQIFQLLPFLLIGVIYLAGTSLFSGMPSQKVYQPVFAPKSILNSLSWYTLWSFGLSEIFADFIGSKFSINPSLMKYYGQYTIFSLFSFITLLLALLFIIFKIKKKIFEYKPLLFFGISYLAALSPFMLFPQHKSSYYLSLSTAFFSAALACIISSGWKFNRTKVAAILFLLVFTALSYQTVKLNHLTYWAAKRAPAAKHLLSEIKKAHPSPAKGTIFYIKDDPDYPFIAKEWGTSSKQAFYILSGADAFKLIYGDSTINVYFEGIGISRDADLTKAIQYTAKFPY